MKWNYDFWTTEPDTDQFFKREYPSFPRTQNHSLLQALALPAYGIQPVRSGQQKLVSKLYWSPVFGRSFDIPAFPAWCIKGAWADYKLKPEIALTKLISKDNTYIIELISWSTCLTFKMNRMNVFECPSERDTEKEISHRYENIKHTPTGEKGKKKAGMWVHLNEL